VSLSFRFAFPLLKGRYGIIAEKAEDGLTGLEKAPLVLAADPISVLTPNAMVLLIGLILALLSGIKSHCRWSAARFARQFVICHCRIPLR
jgi:hypothetical protein